MRILPVKTLSQVFSSTLRNAINDEPIAHFLLPGGALVSIEDERISKRVQWSRVFHRNHPRLEILLVVFRVLLTYKVRLVITPEDGTDPVEILIPKWRQLNVFMANKCRRGDNF